MSQAERPSQQVIGIAIEITAYFRWGIMWRSLPSAIFFIWSSVSSAEYRAFELKISNSLTGKTRIVRSILDQGQYRQYYYLSPAEIVEYQDSWMCFDRSDHFKPICANPHESQDRLPAAAAPNP